MRIEFTRGSRKHRIGRAHARHVLLTTEPQRFPAAGAKGDTVLWFVGRDTRGVELEIAALELLDAQVWLVTHIFPTALRRKRTR